MSKLLLIVMALVESVTGLGLLIAPSWIVELLLGDELSSPQSLVLGRILGSALISIGVACWWTRNGEAGQRGALVGGMLIYNLAVPLILTWAAITHGTRGIAIWPACGLHFGLAVWCMFCVQYR